MRRLLGIVVLLAATPLFADRVEELRRIEEVRKAEIAFAKAFADRDAERFASFIADDANFLSGGGTQRGKSKVVEAWSRLLKDPVAPFSWGPERVEVTADGNLALSTGPVYDLKGKHVSNYISTWRRGADGQWQVVFDIGGAPAPLAEDLPPYEEGFVTTADGAKLWFRKIGAGPVRIIAPFDVGLHDALRQFSDIATIVTYDLRNRGKSSKLASLDSVSIQQDVADLEAVRSHFAFEKFTPIGFSYLGKMVMLYAAANPGRVRRIVQLGPVSNAAIAPSQRADEDLGVTEAELKKWNEMKAAGAAEKSPREYCEAQWGVFRYYFVGNPKNAGRMNVAEMCALENEWPVNLDRHMEKLFPSITSTELDAASIAKIAMPVLTIHGTRDRNAPYAGGRAWAASLPDARLVTVDGAAHILWYDDPSAVFGAIRQFLRGEWPLGSEKVGP